MQLYPAIDMKNGKCVRLRQGAFKDITVYSEHPEEIAALWQEKGATFLHLVDLDGALAGRSVNEETIKKIVSSVNIPVEIGGGIRSEEAIKNMLALGVKRVIIGTKAVEEPEFLKDMVEKFGADAIAAGVDPIHLGLIISVQCAIGSATPPFGCNIFTASAIFNTPYLKVIKGVPAYIICSAIASVLFILVPQTAMFFYNLVY